MVIYTIGHSTRTINAFIEILKSFKITRLIDVRTVPRSKYVPQYNEDNLSKILPQNHIAYEHKSNLGGLRYARKDSINKGWRNDSFRGYADYMQSKEFTDGINQLVESAKLDNTVIMCAEAVPWRCHRSMIGDALLVRNINVIDIYDENKSKTETLTSFAKVTGTSITYP